MLDLADELSQWIEQGRDFAVATVVTVTGSAPRQPGAALAVDTNGTVVGSVSGGCVEATVYALCERALSDDRTVLAHFSVSEDDPFVVGLTCGGSLDILIMPLPKDATARPALASALSAAARGEETASARIVHGPADLTGRTLVLRSDGSVEGGFGTGQNLDRTVAAEARALLHAGRTGMVEIGNQGSHCGAPISVLVEVSAPAPRMIVFGAIDFASALVRVGKFLGYHVTVCDARPVFTTEARFPEADNVVVEWPHAYLERTSVDHRTVLCVLTHDAKFDIPLLRLALRLPVAYVGAMGSRRTHKDRHERLLQAGVTERELDRLRSPIGLDLGARTPEETALSIAAEIIAARHGGSGTPLTHGHTAIHRNDTLPHTTSPRPPAAAPPGTRPVLTLHHGR
ncbi:MULTISPECIES: XdhC family protein [Streptomyces]|uniref:XdhC family protein n=1 Tax=Streptomyces TaxID=1883 RepID=UPI00099D0A2B|nr:MULTISPECIES: XdhC/CoxI family protein [Streptomyces]RZF09332.1 XshC-Cox1-family protein [Streptomyces albidoflavus]